MRYKSLISRFLILLFTLGASGLWAQDVDVAEGETLFKSYCASCHNKKMKQDMTGPALAGTEERWADYPREDLYSWIRNSQAMIQAGHPRATELWNEWGPTVMTSWPALTDPQIENILGYINAQANKVDEVVTNGGPVGTAEETDNTLMFVLLVAILAILAVVLARIINNLNYLNQAAAGGAVAQRKTLVQILTSKSVIAVVLFLAVVIGGFMTVNNAINLGRQQGYAPEQPINFSHATHAGLHQIDCQYCHDGARRSKHSVIPAANTCMNCHSAIKVGSSYGTAELTKIYVSTGYDPSGAGAYIEDYMNLPMDEVETIYKKWIEANVPEDDYESTDEKEDIVENQWDAIVASLTNPTKDDPRGPIEWVRIHNLPDHVYFNHAQHVSVGEVECQTCHGAVEEMEVVQQHSPLSMGWCINCHRQTEVQFAGNEYYQTYQNYHEEISSGARTGVTVEEIGGLECQKCHY